ncbi:MAG: DnaA N-terminal domain-containing protein [Pseudomonadota bacterium]
MQTAKAIGRHAASRKYDLMTALGVHALARPGHLQILTLRFMTLLTARYNWQTDELSMGRAEMARLWSVTERTVKRDLARLRTLGWLSVKRPGARGRVTLYSVDITQVLMDTRDSWPLIGPDFVARMAEETLPRDPKVIPLHPAAARDAPDPTGSSDDTGPWGQIRDILHSRHPDLYAAWFAPLNASATRGAEITLTAPTRFAADYISAHLMTILRAAAARVDPALRLRIATP